MKKITFSLVLFCITYLCNAQFLELNGVTIQLTSMLYVEDGEAKSINVDQLLNVSFKDGFLFHTKYKDGSVDVSQVYKITIDSKLMDGDVSVIKFSALSGVSGNTFKYTLKIDNDGKLISVLITEMDGTKSTYKGGITSLKTFKQ
jgi:hypothetical protein